MKYIYLIAGIFLSLIYISNTEAATSTDCSMLGYNSATPDCSNSNRNALKCPFDNTKVFCGSVCASVSVGKYELCTKKCATDNNVCIEKRDMQCSEYISANNGEKIAHDAYIIGNKTRNLYLMGTGKAVTGSNAYLNRATFTQINIYAAEDIPACKAEGAKPAYLNFSGASTNIVGWAGFYVKADLGYLSYQAGASPTWNYAYFHKQTSLSIDMQASSMYSSQLRLYFDSDGEKTLPNNTVRISCNGNGSSQWRKDTCDVSLEAGRANIKYQKNITGQNVDINLTCESGYGEGTCEESYY